MVRQCKKVLKKSVPGLFPLETRKARFPGFSEFHGAVVAAIHKLAKGAYPTWTRIWVQAQPAATPSMARYAAVCRQPLKLLAAALLIALLLTALPGCRGAKNRRARKNAKPPVIVFVIDTWRSDHTGCYGYERNVTPNIDALAKNAVRFTTAHAASSWTVPSVASLFTGVYPWDHGVTKAEVSTASSVDYQLTLADEFTTLAESMKEAGYETFGVSANYHLHEKYGMAQGFDHFKAFGFRVREPVDLQIKDWLPKMRQAVRQGKPYFLYVHYFDPHHPYLPVEPFIREWMPEYDSKKVEAIIGEGFMTRALEGEFYDQPEMLQAIMDLYDSEIRAGDDSVGRWLKELPGIDEALIVVTSDHGEAFGDHRNMIHGHDLYTETLQVPLVMRFPGGEHAGRAPSHAVSLVDLFPTIAKYVGAAVPDYVAGKDLLGQLDNPPVDRYLFAETERVEGFHWRAVITTKHKWMLSMKDKRQEFYDLTADPREQNNLILPARTHAMASEFYAVWVKNRKHRPLFKPGNAGTISPELRNQLKALGYL